MKVTFLGTTCMQPTVDRNHSAILISHDSENILFDCGEGTQRQLKIAGVRPTKITKICISHWHGDHVLGLPGLLSTMSANECSHTIEIYGPKGSRALFSHMKKAFASLNAVKYKLIEVDSFGDICVGKDFVLESYKLKHSTPCIGFSFRLKDTRKVDMKKARKLGIEAGPHLSTIVAGKSIKVNGKTISPDMISSLTVGRKIAYVADTRPCPGALKLATGADLLIVESTFHSSDMDAALKHDHMTAKESGELAAKADVKQVVLTHPSLRYKTVKNLVSEAKKAYGKRSISFAKDFMVVDV